MVKNSYKISGNNVNKIMKLKNDDDFRKLASVKNKEVAIPYCIENTLNEVLSLFN